MKSLLASSALAVNLWVLVAMGWFALSAYPGFGAEERSAFPTAYSAFTARIGWAVVPWEFLAFLVPLALYATRPDGFPAWAVHVAVALGVAYFAITFGWHLPSHRALAAGDNSSEALKPLLTSQWVRTVVQVARVAVLAWGCVAR